MIFHDVSMEIHDGAAVGKAALATSSGERLAPFAHLLGTGVTESVGRAHGCYPTAVSRDGKHFNFGCERFGC